MNEQPAPAPAAGDVGAELIEAEEHAALRAALERRRAVGMERYGTVLQRGNGRNMVRDALEEALDGMFYAQGCDRPDVVAMFRAAWLALHAPALHEVLEARRRYRGLAMLGLRAGEEREAWEAAGLRYAETLGTTVLALRDTDAGVVQDG